MWWVKISRPHGPDGFEVWVEEVVHPTVNGYDLGDVRQVCVVEAYVGRQRAGRPPGGKGLLLSRELSLTLLAANDQSVFQDIGEKMIVRRLTPTEYERLQGFPDGWTDGQAVTTRYKQMGNAVTVNVVEVVGRAIMEAENARTD